MDSNKQIRYSHYQISDKVQFGGLMDPEQCKQLAKKVLSLYDSNGDGSVDSFEIGYMISDCYRAMNKGFNPTPTDIASYTRVLDRRGTGRVTADDIESLCLKYFGGNFGSGGGQGGLSNQTPIISPPPQINLQAPPVQQRPQYQIPSPVQQVSQPPPQDKFSRIAHERLEVARRIFRKIDHDQNGYLTETEVPDLLRETYKQMGMNYEPTQDDVDVWMKMTDSDQDGKVTLEDYENLVLKSLRQQGITLS